MSKLAQQTINALIANLAKDAELRHQAIRDPKAFVKHHFELTEPQARLVDTVSEAHWHEISDHLSQVTFENGGTFTYILTRDTDQVPGELAKAKVEANCEAKVEIGPNGETKSAGCKAGCSWD